MGVSTDPRGLFPQTRSQLGSDTQGSCPGGGIQPGFNSRGGLSSTKMQPLLGWSRTVPGPYQIALLLKNTLLLLLVRGGPGDLEGSGESQEGKWDWEPGLLVSVLSGGRRCGLMVSTRGEGGEVRQEQGTPGAAPPFPSTPRLPAVSRRLPLAWGN